MRVRPFGLALACILAVANGTRADTIVLTDGRILGGVVKQVKDGYEVTSPDGKATFVPIADVKSIKITSDSVNSGNAKERLASLRRSVDAEAQIDRIIERYKQFIDMNKQSDIAAEARKDLAEWQSRLDKKMVKVGKRWMTPAERDAYLIDTAKSANDIADLIAAGNVAEAGDRVAKALEADPANLSIAYLDGVLQMRRERFNEAKRSFDIVLEQVPDHPPTLLNSAALAANFKRWNLAIPMLEKAMTLAPNNQQILDGVTEFIELIPDGQRRTAPFDRMQSIYATQEAVLAAEMAKRGLYRVGSLWADQAKLDEIKKKQEEHDQKKKDLQAEFDQNAEQIRTLQASIERITRQLEEIEQERIRVDPTTGRLSYLPRPQYYYDLEADRTRYTQDIRKAQDRAGDIKKEAQLLEKNPPASPFTGRIQPIGEAGVPIVLPAGATLPGEAEAPGETPPTTRRATPAPPPLLTPLPEEESTTRPSTTAPTTAPAK